MRLQSYILNEGRTKPIDYKEVLDILYTKCKQSFNSRNKYPIYRLIKYFSDGYGIIYPKPGERKSFNTSNYYTLIINNDPAWKGFPKREIICSTYKLGSFDSSYMVFPFDGAKIGICPTPDIWGSFIPAFPSEININLLSYVKKEPKTYKEMKEKLSNIKIKNISLRGSLKSIHYENYGGFETLFDLVFSIYGNPDKYGFKVVKIGSPLPPDKEVWTDSPCLFIRGDLYYKMEFLDV